MVIAAGVLRVLPKPLKPAVFVLLPVLVAVCTVLGRDWLKLVMAVVAGTAGDLLNWKMEVTAGVKLAAEAGGAPKRKGCEVEAEVLVMLLRVLAALFTPKLKGSFKVESVEVLAVVTEATVEVAGARGEKMGELMAAVVTGAVAGLKKGVDRGMDTGCTMLPKMGLKVGVAVLVVVVGVVLVEAVTAREVLDGKGPSLSTLGGGSKMGLNMGEAEDGLGAAAGAAWWEGGGLSISNAGLCLGAGPGLGGVEALAGVSAWGARGRLVSTVAAETAGTGARRVAVGFVSEEEAGRGPDKEEASGIRRLGVFGGVGAIVAATPAGSEKDGKPGGLCIFFKLSSRGFAPGTGRDAGEDTGTVAGKENVKEGCVVAGLSVTEFEATSALSSKTLLNHCSEAFFCRSRSSAVTE